MSERMPLKTLGKLAYLALTGGIGRTAFSIHGVEVQIPREIDTRIRFFIARRRYENSEAALIRKHIPKGATVIELGGALGVISKVVRDQIGPDGTHIVVEPNPAIIDVCRTNAAHPKTHVLQAALAYGADEVELSQDASLLDNRLVDKPRPGQNSFRVPTTTLAALHKVVGGGRFSLVCDIEGAEADLTVHDPAAWAQCDRIIMEVHPGYIEERGSSLDELLGQLKDLGFTQVSLAKNALYMTR